MPGKARKPRDPDDFDTYDTDVFPEGVPARAEETPAPRTGTAIVRAGSLFGRRTKTN
jgi:hypothetical protein